MHSLLEDYLSEVAAHLSALPIKKRNEELREMRSHLENAVIVSHELGRSEDETARNIVTQFGTAQDLGDNLVWAWQCEKKLNRRSLWGAAVCTLGLLFLVPVLMTTLHSLTGLLTDASIGMGGPLLAGAVSGRLFSKRVVAGTALGAVSFHYVFGLSVFAYWISQQGNLRLVEPLALHVGLFFVGQTESVLLTVFAAWVGSRLQLTWRKHRRLARV